MDVTELAEVLASSDDRPDTRSRILYLVEEDGELAAAGYADAVGEVVDVLDRLDTEGAAGLAVQTRIPGAEDTWAAAVATRDGQHALAISAPGGRGAVLSGIAPAPNAASEVHRAWPVVVHALAALECPDAIPQPPDDPHPGAYLMAAWLARRLSAVSEDADPLDDVDLPDEGSLVEGLGLDTTLSGWDAVDALAREEWPELASRLGRNGVAWEAHLLLGDPSRSLAALASTGHVDAADRLFAQLLDRGWARRA